MKVKRLAILVGGSDLFSGLRGISKGTKIIEEAIKIHYDEVIAINYNYFFDAGRTLKLLYKYFNTVPDIGYITLYGYSKGGEVVLQFARLLQGRQTIDLLITIDIANGPWSKTINRNVPANVVKNINVFQRTSRFPLYSHGMAAHPNFDSEIQNIDVTDSLINGCKVNHSNIEMLFVQNVVSWLTGNHPNPIIT